MVMESATSLSGNKLVPETSSCQTQEETNGKRGLVLPSSIRNVSLAMVVSFNGVFTKTSALNYGVYLT